MKVKKNNSNFPLNEKKYSIKANSKINKIKPKFIRQITFSKPKSQVATENNLKLEYNTTNKNKNIDKI